MGQVTGVGTTVVRLAKTAISSAQLLNIVAAPVAVTPTAPAGQAIFVLQVWATYHFGTVHYTGTDTLQVTAENVPSYQQFSTTTGVLLGSNFNTTLWFNQAGAYNQSTLEFDHTDLAGGRWTLNDTLASDPPVGGDGTITVYCTYVQFAV